MMRKLASWALVLMLTGCGLFGHPDDDPEGPGPNTVRFTLDGQSVEIREELAYAVHDLSRDLLGPFTQTYLEAGSPATDPTKILGPKLQVNLPEGTTPGTYRLAFALFPSSLGPWVRFRESTDRTWTAYDGELTVLEAGGVGGRMRVRFDSLKLSSECGEERTLTAGEIDVAVGAETVFPESEVQIVSPDPSLIDYIGNTVTLSVNGRRWLCTAHTIGIETIPGSRTDSGLPVEAMNAQAVCACGPAPDELRWVSFLVPLGQAGPVTIQGNPYRLFLGVDEGTPTNLADDLLYIPTRPTEVDYVGPIEAQGSRLQLEASAGNVLSEVDPSTGVVDQTRNVILGDLRLVGEVEHDCRPGLCP